MPQFDPATFSPQIIWLVISFTILYIAMSRVALPRISHVLEERQHKIDESLKKAAALQKEALAAAEAYEKMLAEARSEAQEILRQAREKMSAEAAKRQSELGERLSGEIKAAEERIEKAKTEAMTHVREMAVEAAVSAAEKLAGETFDAKTAAAAVGDALKGSP